MNKIVFSTTSFGVYDDSALELCKRAGFEITLNPYGRKVKPAELVELAKGAVGLVAGTELLTKDVLSQLPVLRVISRCGSGMDNVDINAANKLGIKVFNTPYGPTIAVAELTIGLILNLLRKVNRMGDNLRQGKWEKLMGNLLRGKRVGIIGFGHIGQQVGELISSFGVSLSYYDIEPKICSFDCVAKSFEEILSWADIITLHLSGSSNIISDVELKLMKKGSWLINVSRGGLVDENCLYRCLKEGHLAGAAVDVFRQEPYNGRLKDLDNIILTPHIGSYAKESRIEMEKLSVENLLKGIKNG